MFKLDLEKARNQRSNCQHLLDHWKSKRFSVKTSTSALLIMPKPLTVWITTICRKFFNRWVYQITLPASWETCMQIKKQHWNWTWKNRLVPNWETVRQGCILSLCLFSLYAEYIMWNAGLDEAQAEIKMCPGNFDMQICRWHHPYGTKRRKTKEPLDERERGEWKSWLKTQRSEN